MRVAILSEPFDALREVARHRDQLVPGEHGACAIFTGDMRTKNHKDQDNVITKMYLEHYPQMTERHLYEIAETALKQWDVQDVLLLHRVGDVLPGETIVLTCAWAAHRNEAFAAARFMIEDLKARAPFWKKEYMDDDSQWVSHNTPPSADAQAWMKKQDG